MVHNCDMPDADQPFTLPYSFETIGLVLDYLSRHEAFGAMTLGVLAAGVRLQLRHKHHFVLRQGSKLVGYLGWMPTSTEIAEAWVAGVGPLTPVLDRPTQAAALTVVAADNRTLMRQLIRASREANPGRRAYFSRVDLGGDGRKASVLNSAAL